MFFRNRRAITWPLNKEFAFTIIDDTDNSTMENVKLIYEFLLSRKIYTTKTVWVFPSRDNFKGTTIQDKDYLDFLLKLENEGFEIQIHNVGSGNLNRDETIKGFEIFKENIGRYPSLHVNHCVNLENIYWGYKRFGPFLSFFVRHLMGKTRRFYGDELNSRYFWGDLAKKHIKYIRNRVFNGINTLAYDPKMPFREKNKKYSNYWFSSSDGQTVDELNSLISRKNVDRLIRENGLCIVYTHFANRFLEKNGDLNRSFRTNIEYLASKNGWFVPASEILDFLLKRKKHEEVSLLYLTVLDIKWLFDRIYKKLRYSR
jgi:hypothetical protein